MTLILITILVLPWFLLSLSLWLLLLVLLLLLLLLFIFIIILTIIDIIVSNSSLSLLLSLTSLTFQLFFYYLNYHNHNSPPPFTSLRLATTLTKPLQRKFNILSITAATTTFAANLHASVTSNIKVNNWVRIHALYSCSWAHGSELPGCSYLVKLVWLGFPLTERWTQDWDEYISYWI